MATSCKPTNILIFGATGLIGSYIASAILASKDKFQKIGIFSSASSVQRKAQIFNCFKAAGADIITGDIASENDVTEAYNGYDTVVSALGREGLAMQVDLVRLAEQSTTIQRFFPSEFGTDIEYSEASTHEDVHQQKMKVRHYFRDHVQRLEHTYLMTGPYAEFYFGCGHMTGVPQIGSFDSKHKRAWLLSPVDAPIGWTTMSDVGMFLVAALLHPSESCNKALRVHSFVASHADVLAEFEKHAPGPWDTGETSMEQLAALEKDAWSKDSPLKFTCSLRRLWMRGESIYPEWDNKLLGDPTTQTLEEVVEKIVLHPDKSPDQLKRFTVSSVS